ncbi:Putative TonB-dependent outer membrane receptor protein [Croceitalea dokdonensis DOKDO 023]|uniref:Putative TonB-dependent outer membrane receptor protein n=1 Tax=Croceitalea dokdonensis DOKDO 023 TaxID=1300341 RepID=A0A0P7A797_9FLAO|nr:TonB-dependent receptor [Croceitalea dokdonensis]KPM32640.1 Putative TonB-dependent outer membrane receptor protein [Croceitalea dokdonensis DOKDO 023]
MQKIYRLVALLIATNFTLYAQEVTGLVVENIPNGKELPLAGANVYWLNSPIGATTDQNGRFTIPQDPKYDRLVISYIGFITDTLTIGAPKDIKHILLANNQLEEVVVEKKRDAVKKTFFSAQNVVTINSAELLKAACCNLSESFETNPAIDVNFNDALTGTKQIQMLGLTSPYLMITQENIPMVRGASQVYGLTFTPGTWVESIQITKGAGSVVNGFESISGQINTEIVKPLTDYPVFLNGYANLNGRLELNAHINQKISDRWSTGINVHANNRSVKVDNNGDGFLDAPLADQINVQNRWQYQNPETGWVSFLSFRYLNDDKQVGQVNYEPSIHRVNQGAALDGSEIWGSEINTNRFDSSAKLGYVFPELPFQSIGFQASYSNHKQDAYFGLNQYDIDHQSLYTNLIFNSIIGNTKNKFKAGLNAAYDGYDELVNDQAFQRVDRSLGAFFEYGYEDLERLSVTAGVRFDTHNRLGNFFTPRIHARYTPWERASLRASFGLGRRAANIFAENQRLFASSRVIQLNGNGGDIYGFDAEKAMNFGVSYLQGFTLFNRPGNVSVDFYRTDFENQVVVDWENPSAVRFTNLTGESFANSLQVEFNYEILPSLELRTAYKYYDVKTSYQTGLLQQPLQAQNRYFLNLGYETKIKENGSQWRFDYTLHTVGEQRLPGSENTVPTTQFGRVADGYSLMNAQITKVFSKKFEVYLGGENLTGVRQGNPVLGASDPFGPDFDTTVVFRPILGTMVYTGFRFKG